MEYITYIVASLSKDDTTPVNDGEHFIRDVSLTGIGDSLKEKSPVKDNVAVENEYVYYSITYFRLLSVRY